MIAVVALVVAVANAAWVAAWSWWMYRRMHPKDVHSEGWPPDGYRVFTTPENRL